MKERLLNLLWIASSVSYLIACWSSGWGTVRWVLTGAVIGGFGFFMECIRK